MSLKNENMFMSSGRPHQICWTDGNKRHSKTQILFLLSICKKKKYTVFTFMFIYSIFWLLMYVNENKK